MALLTPFLLVSFPLGLFPHIPRPFIEKMISRHSEHLSPWPDLGMVKMHVTLKGAVTIYKAY